MSRSLLDEIEILSEDDGRHGSDYTLIHRASTPLEIENSTPSPHSNDVTARSSPKIGNFKCSQCFKTIEMGRPIYMRNDFPYCSKECRELGVSSIYRALFGSSVDRDTGFVTRLIRSIGGSSSASVSSIEETEDEADDPNHPGVASAARARAKSFLRSIVGSVSKTSLGSSFIRTYSNSVIWGKDMTRNTSFNMLFAYLPEVHEVKNVSSLSTSNPSPTSPSGSTG
jgi:hypothetical protein